MRAPKADAASATASAPNACTASKLLASALEQDADKIDHHVGAARRGLDRSRVAQVGLHRVDLADPAERLQVAGEFRPAHRDADAVAALAQRAHDVAAEKARAAIDRDQRVDMGMAVISCSSPVGRGHTGSL